MFNISVDGIHKWDVIKLKPVTHLGYQEHVGRKKAEF